MMASRYMLGEEAHLIPLLWMLILRHDFNEKNTLEVQVVGTLSSSDYKRDNQYFLRMTAKHPI